MAARKQLVCCNPKGESNAPCNEKFSTHSSNRTVCHRCRPKAPKHPLTREPAGWSKAKPFKTL